MTIDEAIKHAEEIAYEQDRLCKIYDGVSGYTRSHNEKIRTTDAKKCEKCADEHRQLAEWLNELKQLSWVPCSERFPEKNGGYLVTTNLGYVSTAIWMPLPKIYNPESEKKYGKSL